MIIIITASDSSEEDSAEYTSLTMFLAAIGLHDWAPKASPPLPSIIMIIMIMIILFIIMIMIMIMIPFRFQFIRERIDLEALMLLSEADLGEVSFMYYHFNWD